MRYTSPAWLFDGCLPEPFDVRTLRLRRTQLLADLELTGITIEYHGEVLTKNDIINLFEELEKENTLAWHLAIAKDKVLLDFLEDIHFDDWAVTDHWVRYKNNPLYENAEFIEWLSPYYYDSFVFYMEVNCLRAANIHALTALLGVPLLMTPADTEKAWQVTRQLLEKPIDQIRRYGAEASSETELARTRTWMEEGFLALLHLLPEVHFADIRDRYALTIAEACANVQKKSRKYPVLTLAWLENAIHLAVSPQIRSRIEQQRSKGLEWQEQVNRFRKMPLRAWIMIIAALLLCYFIGHKSH